MVYKSLYKDFFYEDSGSTQLSYYLTCDNETIYAGKATNPKGIKLNIRKLVEDWVQNDMPDFRPFDGELVLHEDACKVFRLYDEESNLLEEYMVFLSYEPLAVPMFVYRGINGHADPRQKIFFSMLTEEAVEVDIDEDDGYDPSYYSGQCLTFEILSGSSIWWRNREDSTQGAGYIQYSKDDGATWTELPSYEYQQTENEIQVSPGDKVLFKGNSIYGIVDAQDRYFDSDCVMNVYGNIASMTGWNETTCYRGTFVELFFNPNRHEGLNIVSAENLIIPYSKVGEASFYGLFLNCRMLVKAPKRLPATDLSYICYSGMFSGCSSLKTVPELPAMFLKESCYSSMFADCSSLEYPPELPATNLAYGCYGVMFGGCTSLKKAPLLPADYLAERCYEGMFYDCKSLKVAPVLIASTLWTRCYMRMFNGSGVQYVKCLAKYLIQGSNYIYEWLGRVPETGVFVKADPVDFTWPISDSGTGIPPGWTITDIA